MSSNLIRGFWKKMENIKNRYNEIAKKNNLPSWEDLDREYELGYTGVIMEISFPLRFVRRRIGDRLAWAANFLQGLLQPNPSSLVSMHESKFFNEEDRKKVVELLKVFMQTERTNLSLDIANSDEDSAKWIKDAHKKWSESKKDLLNLTEKMKTGWKQDVKAGKGAYFG